MTIVKIRRQDETEKEVYTLITFKDKNWRGKEIVFNEVCITSKSNISTIFAKNGERIPIPLWDVVSGFIRTKDLFHAY